MPASVVRRLISGVTIIGAGALACVCAPGSTAATPQNSATAGTAHGRHETLAVRALSSPNHYATSFSTVTEGAPWQDVRALQYLLLSAGLKTNWESTFGASTAAAVSAYQSKMHLPVTGVGDDATLAKLTPTTGDGANTYRSFAIQTLLEKHGYWFGGTAPAMSTTYNAITTSYVRSFQVGHGINPVDWTGITTWRTLFAAKTSGALYPLLQRGTGAAQWSNCGPASAVAMMIEMARVAPTGWQWNIATRATAINDFRYGAMGVGDTAARNGQGTEFADFEKAFASYGLSAWHGGIDDTLIDARAGKPSIAGGDASKLPWADVSGPVSHWVAVLGFNGTYYLVMDPLSRTNADYIHRMTEGQLRDYAATNPGHPSSTAASNSILLR